MSLYDINLMVMRPLYDCGCGAMGAVKMTLLTAINLICILIDFVILTVAQDSFAALDQIWFFECVDLVCVRHDHRNDAQYHMYALLSLQLARAEMYTCL